MKIISIIGLMFFLGTVCFTVANSSGVENLTLRRAKPNTFLEKLLEYLKEGGVGDESSTRKEPDKTVLTIDPLLKPIIKEWEERYIEAMGSVEGLEEFSKYFIPEVFRILRGNIYQLEEILERTLEILVHHLEPMFVEELDPLSVKARLDEILVSLENGTFWSRNWE